MSDSADLDPRRHPSAGAAPGLIDAGEPPTEQTDAGDAGASPVAGGGRRFIACDLCAGACTVVVVDLTAQLRAGTGEPLTVVRPCPRCNASGGTVASLDTSS